MRDTVKRLISDVYARQAASEDRVRGRLCSILQLRAIEKTDFEQRIAKLEKQLNRLKDQLQDPQVKAWRESGAAEAG
ncbi:MAG TPA: hypothetical protein VJP02_03205 [Candidatus Sulfotelmatobacter sp.]|nr:hypothetical protein [Candidatus Sulfotelmatobacter sp.]